jgi:hypothetical protein
MGGICLYFFCYAMTGALLRRHIFKSVGTEFTWLISVALLVVGSFAPFLIGYIIFFDDQWWRGDFGAWLVGNPFAWGYKEYRALYAGVGVAWALIVAAMNAPWFIKRVMSFRRPSRFGGKDFEPVPLVAAPESQSAAD